MFDERSQCQQGGGRKTARICDIFGIRDIPAVEFRQAVNEIGLQFVGGVFDLVKLGKDGLVIDAKIA